MQQTSRNVLASVGLVTLLLTGCAAPTALERDYGTSINLVKTHQRLHPGADQNLQPVEGFDGQEARYTLERYREGFKQQPQKPTFAIPVGDIK
jgi:hypothetical protein